MLNGSCRKRAPFGLNHQFPRRADRGSQVKILEAIPIDIGDGQGRAQIREPRRKKRLHGEVIVGIFAMHQVGRELDGRIKGLGFA